MNSITRPDAVLGLHQLEARLTSSRVIRWEMNGSTSISPAIQRSTRAGTPSRPLTAPNDEPATRRPVIKKRGIDVERLALAGNPGHRREAPGHAGGLDRLAHHLDVAGRLEGVVRAEAVGGLEDLLDHVLAADHRLGRALALGQLEPLGGEIDGR